MTDGDGDGVGYVFGFHLLLQAGQDAHHAAHLLLFGAAVADDAALNFERRIFAEGHMSLRDSQQSHSAHVGEFQGGPDIL